MLNSGCPSPIKDLNPEGLIPRWYLMVSVVHSSGIEYLPELSPSPSLNNCVSKSSYGLKFPNILSRGIPSGLKYALENGSMLKRTCNAEAR